MNLKGQNFRILLDVPGSAKRRVVAKSTSCTVTLTGNTEDASHKDIVGMAAAPTIVSKGWSVQVESLDVTDVVAVLTAIRNCVPFLVTWDETSTVDNQTQLHKTFSRLGKAYMNDVSFSFNDRQNSTKSIQMTGTGPLMSESVIPVQEIIPVDNNFTKGQFVRLFLSEHSEDAANNVIAAAKELTLHCSMQLEDATTKDTQGSWQIMEPTGFSFDISSSALMRSSDTITSQVEAETLADIEGIFERSVPVNFDICFVNGDNQRTKYDAICNGQVIITSLVMNGPNRNNADYNTTLNGFGQLHTNEPTIVRIDFPLPISQSELYELGHGQIVFDRAVSADDLAEKLVIVFGDMLGTIATNASGVSISVGVDQMAGLQPNEDETVWSLTGISQNGPVWEGISII